MVALTFISMGSSLARVTPPPAPDRSAAPMHVWIDQDLCTGDGLCQDIAPDVFVILEDGIAYVRQDGVTLNDPGGSHSLALVPTPLESDVVAAADVCPGECIFIELDS
jgi:ferredoxin